MARVACVPAAARRRKLCDRSQCFRTGETRFHRAGIANLVVAQAANAQRAGAAGCQRGEQRFAGLRKSSLFGNWEGRQRAGHGVVAALRNQCCCGFACGGKVECHPSAVFIASAALDQACGFKPVDEPDRTRMRKPDSGAQGIDAYSGQMRGQHQRRRRRAALSDDFIRGQGNGIGNGERKSADDVHIAHGNHALQYMLCAYTSSADGYICMGHTKCAGAAISFPAFCKGKTMLISQALEQRLASAGQAILRYSLVFFFLAFGLYKFTPQEAAAIAPLMAHSPFLFWAGPLLGEQMASNLIGVTEIAFGLMVALRSVAPRVSAWGSVGIAGALVMTLSFLFTTPGLDPESSDAGFLLKDLTLLGAALWSAAEAFAAARLRGASANRPTGKAAPLAA